MVDDATASLAATSLTRSSGEFDMVDLILAVYSPGDKAGPVGWDVSSTVESIVQSFDQ